MTKHVQHVWFAGRITVCVSMKNYVFAEKLVLAAAGKWDQKLLTEWDPNTPTHCGTFSTYINSVWIFRPLHPSVTGPKWCWGDRCQQRNNRWHEYASSSCSYSSKNSSCLYAYCLGVNWTINSGDHGNDVWQIVKGRSALVYHFIYL